MVAPEAMLSLQDNNRSATADRLPVTTAGSIITEVTYLLDGMLQPTGLQAAADEVELELFVPKSEKAFSTFRPPHLGHLTSGAEEKERTSFSNFSPHS